MRRTASGFVDVLDQIEEENQIELADDSGVLDLSSHVFMSKRTRRRLRLLVEVDDDGALKSRVCGAQGRRRVAVASADVQRRQRTAGNAGRNAAKPPSIQRTFQTVHGAAWRRVERVVAGWVDSREAIRRDRIN